MSTTAKLDPQVALAELQERKPDRVTIVVLSGSMDRVMSAFIIATGAASMGMQVTMFFTFWGLNVKNIVTCIPIDAGHDVFHIQPPEGSPGCPARPGIGCV